jgi:bifunctional DNA-binding transcriptional regulator/antitoxin component of YhaV-PrlF toxin-antitoxin module
VQGRTVVPGEIRKKLGIGPGRYWNGGHEGGVVVRRVGRFSSEDVYNARQGWMA